MILSTSTGCVYWRLYKVRGQLAAFETHCTLTHDPGAHLGFRDPVLKPTDVEWLLDRMAQHDGDGGRYLLAKQVSDGDPGDRLSRIELRFLVAEGRVTEFVFPPQFNTVLNRDTLSRVFVGADRADVEASGRSTGWQLHRELEIPRIDRVQKMLGAPTRREDTELHQVLVYAYDLEPKPAMSAQPDAVGVLVFDRDENQMIHAVIHVGALYISVYRNPEGRYNVQLKRQPHDA